MHHAIIIPLTNRLAAINQYTIPSVYRIDLKTKSPYLRSFLLITMPFKQLLLSANIMNRFIHQFHYSSGEIAVQLKRIRP